MPVTTSIAALSSLSALLTGAAFCPLAETAWIRVTGADRVRWLNGMVTNSIGTLAPGAGCYNFVLNAQGRIQGDLNCFAAPSGDALLLETDRAQVPTLLAFLDRFIIMDEVELAEETPALAGLLLAGPHAADILQGLGLTPPPADAAPCLVETQHVGGPARVLHAFSPVVPRFELWAAPTAIATIAAALERQGIAAATPADVEQLRVLEGRPAFGVDIRERELPQETALPGTTSRALHFAKGCYLGQEIVERIRSRGSLHRTLAGLLLEGELPPPGTPLTAAEAADTASRSAGEITSAATLHLPDGTTLTVALAYLRRDALEAARTVPLVYAGGRATPVQLPWRFPVS